MTNYKGHRDLVDRPVIMGRAGDISREADVVVVGSGAAAHSAAILAAGNGASVVMVEAADRVGGTSWRSSGAFWVPNNAGQRSDGIVMDRESTLKHMALLAYPESFDETDRFLGLSQREYDLIALYFDMAPVIADEFHAEGVVPSTQTDWPNSKTGFPPYYDTGYDASFGSVLGVRVDGEFGGEASNSNAALIRSLGGRQGDGADLIRFLGVAADKLGVDVVLGHRVDGLVRDEDGAIAGVTATSQEGQVTFEARRGVIFATGGFSHAPDLAQRYLRGPIVGSCSAPTARGDFIEIALQAGAELGNMQEAWWSELPVELVSTLASKPELMSFTKGASSIIVNSAGLRVVNEKSMYNERGKIHFVRDDEGSYPNRILFLIYDDAVAKDPLQWPARWPIPPVGEDASHVITAPTLDELSRAIADRLADIAPEVDGFALQVGFPEGLRATIERYNSLALAGVDSDFGRGDLSNRAYDPPSREAMNNMKNNTMAPFREVGPYYAIILGAGTLDTKGGPNIDTKCRVLASSGEPIPRLYGAGNCIASPAGAGYWGGGGTLGPALVFGYIAGLNAAKEPVRASVGRHVAPTA